MTGSAPPSDRAIPLQGVHNFRRFGAYPARDGAVADRLYRSGQFSRATPEDLERMDALNVALVADLRRPSEREREPSHWPGREGVSVLASDHAGHAESPHLVFLRESDLTLESIRRFMTETYRRLPFDEGNKAVFRDAFLGLAETGEEHGFIVHCAAGKDRTGIFCALLLTELGVEEEAVREDYLLTNHVVDFDRIGEAVAKRLEAEHGRTMGAREMRAFLGVDADYLDAAWDAMDDPRRYLRETLGLSESEIEAVKTRLLGS